MKGLPVYVPLRERTPIIYGPSLLLLLAACGGGGSAPEPVTGGSLVATGGAAQASLPRFEAAEAEITIEENTPLRAGDAVWAARAEAVGASVRYSLARPGAGDFTVDEDTGQVRYARHLASDYEGSPEGWQFTVVATSSYGRTAYQQVRLKLANLD